MARKILLADDSVTAQNMGRKILTDAGYEVVTVNNGSAALKKISECKPAVVVLDVYMPGYSGLEVCARIKEGRDTEGIPVLLTVGKLEPFRQDEARKVHADGFIIKPFEATELLAALAKLESKAGITSGPQTTPEPKNVAESKSTKHVAATMARYEREVADGAPKFGDHESGWKARLTMPSPGSKHEELAEEPEIAVPSSKPRDRDRTADDRPSFAITSAPSAPDFNSIQGLPGDVTPDELAAIAAAAAAVGGNNGAGNFDPAQQATSADSEQQAGPVTFASESGSGNGGTAYAAGSSAGPVSAQVDAVFTSFAAASSHAAAIPEVKPAPPEPAASSDSASMAVGARWVAEEVPVEPAESALVLEREMHKAFAAFAAGEHAGSYQPGPVDKNDEPKFAGMAPPAIGAPTPFAASSHSALEDERKAEPAEEVSDTPEKPQVAEILVPPASPFTPIASEEPKHAVVAFGEPHPFAASDANTAAQVPEQQPDSEPQTVARDPQTVSDGVASPRDDWHDMRQGVSAAPPSPDKANAGTFEDFNSTPEPGPSSKLPDPVETAMAAAASGDSSSASSSDPNLSSIVDNMLAELKPKLMAELAKKLDKK
ncbi:MAG TPA: response regulator [Terriglobales bacterium]